MYPPPAGSFAAKWRASPPTVGAASPPHEYIYIGGEKADFSLTLAIRRVTKECKYVPRNTFKFKVGPLQTGATSAERFVGIVSPEHSKLGGPGKIAEIDEAKVGRKKYNRGRILEGQWIFGDGTTIISDSWKSYDCLQDEGFIHLRVNHS
ncbi:hypothetical protein NQ317_011999 [Molorchus minor]|uniref:Transposase n=1 Tax=Molorchus minor TaxID=1323400 RepID=A0ABQ9IV98_9CUCU|nr:hypothetical protein NQ317_011999 [Molorchus minor]